MARKDPIADIAAKYGFVLKRAKRHKIWQHPNGAVVTTGCTNSDRKVLLAAERHFKLSAAGLL